MLGTLKRKLLQWALAPKTMTIEEVHHIVCPTKTSIFHPDTGKLKFIERAVPPGVFVKTPSGYSKVKASHKTVKYDIWQLTTEYHSLTCADKHIVIDEYGDQVFVKDLVPGMRIKTEHGTERVLGVRPIRIPAEHMFDLELDDNDHVYYTDGILSHNSTVSSAYLLWYAMFNFDKTILIASNKNSNAIEMVHRIRYAYENLPMWLKPGVQDDGWNKHSVGFDNGSRIISTATSDTAGRGMSISLLFCDEFAFVPPGIQEEFWTSIAPTLSTGGSCIMSSTPNGDMNLFAQIWRGAEANANGFTPIRVHWNDPPGRDEKWKAKEIKKVGERRFEQEYECKFLSSDALLIDSLVLSNMTEVMKKIEPIRVVKDVKFWRDIEEGKTYLIGIDPATGSGSDFSVITALEFPSMFQVAEYRSNTMSSALLYQLLSKLLKHIENKGSSAYFSVENNGVGEGIVALFESDEDPPVDAEFVSQEGSTRKGMTTTNRSKMKACLSLKDMIESGAMTINSKTALAELKSYSRRAGQYQAQVGGTDDTISAILVVIRILEEIASYDQLAHDKLYALSHEGDSTHKEDGDWFDQSASSGIDNDDDDDDVMPMVF